MIDMEVGMTELGEISCYRVGSNPDAVHRYSLAVEAQKKENREHEEYLQSPEALMIEYNRMRSLNHSRSLNVKTTNDEIMFAVCHAAKPFADITKDQAKTLARIARNVGLYHGDYEIKQTDNDYSSLLGAYIDALITTRRNRAEAKAKKLAAKEKCPCCGRVIIKGKT